MNERMSQAERIWEIIDEWYTLNQLLNLHQHDGLLLQAESVIPLAKAILSGLASLHKKGCIYGSLTPDDIVLTDRQGFQLLEPNWMQAPDNQGVASDISNVYLAPETLENQTWTIASDVFCAGIVLGQCLLGRHPFQYRPGESPQDIQNHIKFQFPFMPIMLAGPNRDKGLFALLLAMLIRNPQSRPTADELLSTIRKKELCFPFLLTEDVAAAANKQANGTQR